MATRNFKIFRWRWTKGKKHPVYKNNFHPHFIHTQKWAQRRIVLYSYDIRVRHRYLSFFLPALDGLNLDRNQLWASLTYITPGSKYQLPLKGTLFFDLITKFMCGVCVCALVKKEAVLHFTPLSISCRRKSPGFHRSPSFFFLFQTPTGKNILPITIIIFHVSIAVFASWTE